VKHGDGDGRPKSEADHRPRLSEEPGDERNRRGREHRRGGGVAQKQEAEDPDPRGDEPDQRGDAEQRAAGGRDHLPALGEAHEQRPPVAEHGRAAGEYAGPLPHHQRGDERGHEPLQHVQQHNGQPQPPPVHAPDVGGADVAAAVAADVVVAQQSDEPVAERHAAGEVAAGDEDRD
jgi:hypothetical protein